MSDEEEVEEKPYAIERAKQGRAVCKHCKEKCLQGELRLAKLVYNPFGGGKMKAWHHVECLFKTFLKQRKTTKRMESPDEIDGWDDLNQDEQDDIVNQIKECNTFFGVTTSSPASKKTNNSNSNKDEQSTKKTSKTEKDKTSSKKEKDKIPSKTGKDKGSSNTEVDKSLKNQSFKTFRKLIADITNTDSYLDKTSCVKKTFSNLFPDSSFRDDIILWCRLLLPGVIKRVYNLQSKQLIKLFSRLFRTDQNDMLNHLEQGDIGETIQKFFEQSNKIKPAKKCNLTVVDVDQFLEQLSELTKEEEQIEHFKSFISKCTSNDLKMAIRLIKGDLRMGAGAKHILDGVHENAYENYQISRDLNAVITACLDKTSNKSEKGSVVILTPLLPMLAESCKSVEQAMKKCPNGMYSEIKYDGERVQLHKCGSEFKYFSRSLKPVLPHKTKHFSEYVNKAFPHANDIILDSEILMMDTTTGKPLPFGTLGKHKKDEFKDATVCLFVFDCIYYNGESLIKRPLCERKQILQDNMTEIPNHIMFSEMQEIHKQKDLAKMIAKVLKMGLEGLVLKDIKSIYEPGKRHWLKVKKDYLFDGAMADTADLIVLGAWYGTGKKGGMMSVFLMGCHNPKDDTFRTVTKVHTGHDDKTLEKLQSELQMIKISQEQSKVPDWLKCVKTMTPDFVAKNPKKQPIWEITGAEFTQHDVHTADGISIRFPRVTKIRDDKDWKTATNLDELKQLYINSKENLDVSMLVSSLDSTNSQDTKEVQSKKRKADGPEDKTDSAPKKNKSSDQLVTGLDCTSSQDAKEVQSKKRKADGPEDKSDSAPFKKNKSSDELVSGLNSTDSEDMKEVQSKKRNANGPQDNTDSSPSDEENQETIYNEDSSTTNSVFSSVKAILAHELKSDNSEELKQFVKLGGKIVSDDEFEQATHVIHYYSVIREPLTKCSFNVRHVTVAWVKDSIEEGALKDFKSYTVQWNPDS